MDREDQRPRPASEPRLRCPLCHDELSSEEAGRTPCPGCAALFHDDCRRGSEGCPTLGCAYGVAAGARGEEDRPAPRGTDELTRVEASLAQPSTVRGLSALAIVFSPVPFILGGADPSALVASTVLAGAGLIGLALVAGRRNDSPGA